MRIRMWKILIYYIFINWFRYAFGIFVELVPYSDPSQCNITEYFSVELMKCKLCDSKKLLAPSLNKHECICNEKSVPVFETSSFYCEKCKPNYIFSEKINACIKCTNGLYKRDNKTLCKPCKEIEVMVYHFTNGTFLSQTRCIQCANGMIPSTDGTNCIPCPILNPIKVNGTIKCMCNYKSVLLGNLCIPSNIFPEFSSNKIKYYLQYNNGQKYDSVLFDTHLKLNIYMCKLKNITACEILANLCTLTLYNIYNNSPCSLWLDSTYTSDPEAMNKLPWLFYREGDANIMLNQKKITTQYSLDKESMSSKLNFTGVILHLNGTIKYVKRLYGSDLNLCPDKNYIKNEGLRFGTNYHYKCKVDTKQFFHGRDTEFIIPYLQYWDNNKSLLYAVPVLIRNLAHHKNNDRDIGNWRLVRRFFMFDTVSSIASKSRQPAVLQYVRSLQISVKLRAEDGNGLIYPPLIILEYGEITHNEYLTGRDITFQFSITYDIKSNVAHSIEISIGVLSALAIIYSGIQTWSHSRRSGKIGIDFSTLLQLLLFSCGNLANVFFIVAIGVTVHTFIFYKGQSVAYMLLPTEKNENTIKDYIISAFSLKTVEIITLICHQITVDIFLIDWEKPKPQDTIPRPKKSASPFILSSFTQQSVSVWRSYFIANEWNELQTKRKINLLIHMIIVLFFLKIVGLECWGTVDPELHAEIPEYLKSIPFSFTCRFATGIIVYISAYTIQLCFMMGIYERFIKNSIQQFVDVCSLSNISVFIMSHERYGYYIHGRSSQGFADTDMLTMIKQLQREEQDLCAYRGLLSDSNNQTFTVGIPTKLRLYYNKLMIPTKVNFEFGYNRTELSPSKKLENVKIENIEKRIQAYHNINKFLSAFLEHALKDVDYVVKDKSFIETLLDIEFSECFDRGILYTDNGLSFDKVLFYGNEFTLFSFDIMLFSIILIITDNFVAAILFTVLVFEILKVVRQFGGKKNIACKTIIDERFLI